MTDFSNINKLFLKRFSIYRDYVLKLSSINSKEDFYEKTKALFDDIKDDIETWNEVLNNNGYQVPSILEKTWDNLYKTICYTINTASSIQNLKHFI